MAQKRLLQAKTEKPFSHRKLNQTVTPNSRRSLQITTRAWKSTQKSCGHNLAQNPTRIWHYTFISCSQIIIIPLQIRTEILEAISKPNFILESSKISRNCGSKMPPPQVMKPLLVSCPMNNWDNFGPYYWHLFMTGRMPMTTMGRPKTPIFFERLRTRHSRVDGPLAFVACGSG